MSNLESLRRPSGGFAMLAVDQREALRNMMAEHADGAVTDAAVTDFKLTAARILSPFASAILIDRQFALDRALAERVVDPACSVIASADHFESAHGELVGRVTIDRRVDPFALRDRGVVALKLLVLYRPDGGADERRTMTEEFVALCEKAGLVSIVEPVSRKPLDDRAWDWGDGVFAAAEELGSLGADLYKAEVPGRAESGESAVRAGCRQLTSTISGPWVVLSSGVSEHRFPDAVRWACEEGAEGFLAGRAVWASSLGAADVVADLSGKATERLRSLGSVVDSALSDRRT
jgi:sulfofructosephosphate aldolase